MASISPISDYRPQLLEFSRCSEGFGFKHNFDRDLHLFALWEKASPYWEDIVSDIKGHFVVLAEYEIHWSRECIDDNFLRLYGMPKQQIREPMPQSKRARMVGEGPFVFLVVEDPTPLYIYHQTFSQKVEMVNKNIVLAKARYRDLAEGGLYVHSSNSIAEFFRDGTLILGEARIKELMRQSIPSELSTARQRLDRDISGADGWGSLPELFEHLKCSSDYVVLRNFATLPDGLEEGDGDIDLLCTNAEDFIAVSGARMSYNDGAKISCEVLVAGVSIALDVRFVGDGYYDRAWEQELIASSVLYRGLVSVPAVDHHFFSLLYHAKLHKGAVKQKYIHVLEDLAKVIGLRDPVVGVVTDDENALALLSGFLFEQDYERTKPLDIAVGSNISFVRRLDACGVLWNRNAKRSPIWLRSVLAGLPFVWRIKGRWFVLLEKAFRYVRSRHFAG